MKRIIKELRLLVVVWLVGLALKATPKDCTDTLLWFTKMPLED
jgi:hypothetical protein